MKTKSTGLAAAVAVLMLFGATTAQAALSPCVTITGEQQGIFKAPGVGGLCAQNIEVYAFDYGVISPRDISTGRATGPRMHKAVRITKAWGAASPQLFSALMRNEVLTTVVFDFFSPSTTSSVGSIVLDHTIKLTNAFVTSIEHKIDNVKDPAKMMNPAWENVEFVFQSIELIDHQSKGSVKDSSVAN